MKRIALLLGAFGVVWFSAFSSGPVAAYQPVEAEEFFAGPLPSTAPSGFFEAIVKDAFRASRWCSINVGVSPIDVVADTCDTTSFEASVTFQAPADEGEYNLLAFLAAETSSNPDIPSRPRTTPEHHLRRRRRRRCRHRWRRRCRIRRRHSADHRHNRRHGRPVAGLPHVCGVLPNLPGAAGTAAGNLLRLAVAPPS